MCNKPSIHSLNCFLRYSPVFLSLVVCQENHPCFRYISAVVHLWRLLMFSMTNRLVTPLGTLTMIMVIVEGGQSLTDR
jgi:hypothetical protein